METVLRFMHPHIGETERKFGQVRPSGRDHRTLAHHRYPTSSARSSVQSQSSRPPQPSRRPQIERRPRHVHVADMPCPACQLEDEAAPPGKEMDEEISEGESEVEEICEQDVVDGPEPEDEEGPDGGEDDKDVYAGDGDPDDDGKEAFVAGWRAKNKTAPLRKKRGFVKSSPAIN